MKKCLTHTILPHCIVFKQYLIGAHLNIKPDHISPQDMSVASHLTAKAKFSVYSIWFPAIATETQLALRWENYSGLIEWYQLNHRGLRKWKRKGKMSVLRVMHVRKICWLLLALKINGTISQEMWAACRSWKGKKIDSPPKFPERWQPCWHLDWASTQWDPFQMSNLQNCTVLNLFCIISQACGKLS